MGKIIAIAIQKGGVGKTTTAQALGVGLSNRGKNVLMVDLDVQGNLSYCMGIDTRAAVNGASTLLMQPGSKRINTRSAIIKAGKCDIIAGGQGLAEADSIIKGYNRETRLKTCLDEVSGQYDYIIIDTPMKIGILTINALSAAESVIIPVKADTFSLQGLGQEYKTICEIRNKVNHDLKISGILVNCYKSRTIFSRGVIDQLKATAESMGTKVYNSCIHESIAIPEAQAYRTDIYSYSPRCHAAIDYNSFVDEFIESENK